MTVWKPPVVKSAVDDTHSLCRSSDFGVKTTSGFFFGDRAWRRSRWKWLAGVLGTAPDVVLGAQLEVPLEPAGRVVGALALVRVRQQDRQRAELTPLDL